MAERIRRGYLIEPPGKMMLDKKYHGLLAKMNDRYFLTFDSQSENDNLGPGVAQRPYVYGVMTHEHAFDFVSRLNTSSDYIAIVIHPVQKSMADPGIDVTKTRDRIGGPWSPFTSIPLYTDQKTYHAEMEDALGMDMRTLINMNNPVKLVKVCCIDPTWGRKAGNRLTKSGLFYEVIRQM